ncbi:MAG TPA: class II aldolase/adducin family protein [Chthonomonadales bacterium]|nr:class II aldolase/adducin family protein [Chthonomonadales bacterium]
MPVAPPYPDVEELMTLVGEAGRRLAEIEASEGAAGNISVCFAWEADHRREFPLESPLELPVPVPELSGMRLLITGSGRRLREIAADPAANLGLVVVGEGGAAATLFTSSRRLFERLTSEFNSHLAVHRDQIAGNRYNFHALIHAQPMYLTYLSHIGRYQDQFYLNRHILRWQPESIVNLPEGVGYVPFLLPGSPELMEATLRKMREHRVVLWAKHGVMAKSDTSVKRCVDRIEYAETGAKYEYLDLTNHGLADGLSAEEIRSIAASLGIRQTVF